MKVTITASAVTHVDGQPVALAIGEVHDFPDALAAALVSAGIAEKVPEAPASRRGGKRMAGAPENKSE